MLQWFGNLDRLSPPAGAPKRPLLNSTCKKVKAEADRVGIPMDEREFHCRGAFKGLHRGKPDASDLKAAAEFAKKIAG